MSRQSALPIWGRLLSNERLLMVYGVVLVAGIALALGLHRWTLLLLPVALVVVGLLLHASVRVVLLLLLAVLPFSKEITLSSGLSIDLPSEPLMLLLLTMVLLSALRGRWGNTTWLRHPITFIIALQLCWATYTALFSIDGVHSLKYLLAKLWYLASFYIAAGLFIRRPRDVGQIVWAFLPSLLFTVVWATVRHIKFDLRFGAVNWAIQPFYINHVIYAATIALFLPFTLLAPTLTGKGRTGLGRWLWRAALGILLVGVSLAYTRASWLAVIMGGAYFLAIRWKLIRPILVTVIVSVVGISYWLSTDQHYVLFHPDFEKTIFHGNDLGAHLASTYQLKDVSEMERVYRWVAAARMVARSPLVGSGPSTFYPEYKKYTDKRFRTYVSDNPEKSTTHNYFLLQLVEQGALGLLLFGALVWWALVLPQTLYHRTRDPRLRAIVAAAGMSLCITVVHLTLNELIEVDKIGSFFFLCLMLLARADTWIREEQQDADLSPLQPDRLLAGQ